VASPLGPRKPSRILHSQSARQLPTPLNWVLCGCEVVNHYRGNTMSNAGHCLCGSVSYSISTDPALVGVCHCEDCQRFTGSAFSYLVGVLETDLQIQGELETFSKPGDSGQPIQRKFCPKCGSSILEIAATRPGLVLLNGGTLDNSENLTPTLQIYCDRELTWARLAADIQQFPGAPPE
jgi:hypothetical protein